MSPSQHRLSWQVAAVLGLALLAFGFQLSVTGQRLAADRAAARAAGQPEAVALAAFERTRDVHAAGEVHLIARIDPSAVISVEERVAASGEGGLRQTRRLYLLTDPVDPPDGPLVRAAILLPDDQVGRFLAHVAANRIVGDALSQTFVLNGAREMDPPLARPAIAAIRELGRELSPEFIFVAPWLEGREVALADRETSWRWLVGATLALGGAALTFAVGRWVRERRRAAAARRALEAERIRR